MSQTRLRQPLLLRVDADEGRRPSGVIGRAVDENLDVGWSRLHGDYRRAGKADFAIRLLGGAQGSCIVQRLPSAGGGGAQNTSMRSPSGSKTKNA